MNGLRTALARASRTRRLVLLTLGGLGLALTITGVAWAFWTSTGSGTASATTGTLNQPTTVVATTTAGSSTVGVSWTAPTTGATPTGYYVTRINASNVSSPACGTSPAATIASSPCNDTGVADGTYTYKVTAVINHSWTATSASSAGVTVSTVQTATKLAFTASPNNSPGGTAFTTQPVVTVQDASSNTVTGNTSAVMLSITSPAGATLVCATNPKAAVGGVASFTGCNVDKPGTYTLTATDAPLTQAVSSSFTISVGAANKLAVTTSPNNSTGGVAFTTQPVVTVQDAGGNTVTGNASAVTLAITTPAGATLTCSANPQSAVSGIATFVGCKIDKAGTYTLTASDGGLTQASSSSFTVAVGAASKLGFTTSPSNSTGGTAFTTQPVVAVQDAGGNTVTGNTSSITLAITTPAGATLACTTNPQAAAAGVATFSGCKIDKIGTYTLTASGSFTGAISTSFTITVGAASKLAFTTSPGNSTGGTQFSVQPIVTLQDAGGNTAASDTSGVSLAITSGTGTAGATLTCTSNPLAASGGVSAFSTCRVDKAGSNYTLTATDGSLTTAVSAAFTVAVGGASKLAFTTQPSGSTDGVDLITQPTVSIQDAGGNTVSAGTNLIGLTVPAGATLTCTTNPKNAVAGVAAFAGCAINNPGTYMLTAAASGLASASSNNLTITLGVLTITSKSAAMPQNSTTISGTGGTGGQTLSIQICSVNAFPCAVGNLKDTVAATVLSDGTWTSSVASKLGNGSFFARAVQTTGPSKTSGAFSFTNS
jgi:hypothetical protein